MYENGKVPCYHCKGTGKIEGYSRASCLFICDDVIPAKKPTNLNFEKCTDCKYELIIHSFRCAICNGEGRIDWINELFED